MLKIVTLDTWPFGVPGFQGSRVSEFQGSRVPEFQSFRVPDEILSIFFFTFKKNFA
jgi:hypothetical protein